MFENIPGQESQSFDQASTQDVGQEGLQQTGSPSEQSAPMDLNSVDKFRFEGRDWTPQELKSAYLLQQDYSRKTQALAEERRRNEEFERAWEVDQEALLKDPRLLEQFKKIYPKSYHRLGEQIARYGQSQTQSQGAQSQPPKSEDSPWSHKLTEMERKLAHFEEDQFNAKVATAQAELETHLKTLGEKYPFVDQETALARAQTYHSKGNKLDGAAWEGIYKQLNGQSEARFKEYQSKLAKDQKAANQKARDTASGGGIPGGAPDLPKNLKEARKYLERRI